MTRVALAQMVSSADISENLKQIELLVGDAREFNADLLVLPENCAFMGLKDTDKISLAEVQGTGPIQQKISQLAKTFGIWIIAGTVPLKASADKARASCIVYDDKGLQVAVYDKIHLFDVQVSENETHQESSTTEPGKELVVVDTPVGKIGLTVCYDLRFPELFHQLRVKGAELFTVPSAFTETTGKAHWEVLLRARAIENLSYVLAPNQGGAHENGRMTFGHTMAIDPWGKVVAQKESGVGVVTAEIDLQRVQQLRLHFPCTNHHVLV